MRILDLDIPEKEIIDNGLGRIYAKGLGKLVVIAGPNGSGKTRLLEKLRSFITEYPTDDYIGKMIHDWTEPDTSDAEQAKWKNALLSTREYVHFDSLKDPAFIDFTPDDLRFLDSHRGSRDDLLNACTKLKGVGLDDLPEISFAVIQHLLDRYWDTTHQDFPHGFEVEKDTAINAFNNLNDNIKKFLGTTISRSITGEAQLFGKPLSDKTLSQGQIVLLQFCLALYRSHGKLDDFIILMDEPEKHLHPSVLIEVIETLKNNIGKGQVWISTHSVSLLSTIPTEYLWSMLDGKLSRAGRNIEEILGGLLGSVEQQEKLQEFLMLPSQLAIIRFARESLSEPGVVPPQIKDPQTQQIKKDLLEQKKSLKLLDYGAGKGRLAYEISQDWPETFNISYVAYDLSPAESDACKGEISVLHGSSCQRYYNDLNLLTSDHGEETFDAVVMCNVLHEIEPQDWVREIHAVAKVLKPEGFLKIVEDHMIPNGEKAYEEGFIVLNTRQLNSLFCVGAEEVLHCSDARNDGRLLAHDVPKRLLLRISEDSIGRALADLIEQSKNEIRALRRLKGDFKRGMQHAFWLHELTNAQLVLDTLTGAADNKPVDAVVPTSSSLPEPGDLTFV